MTDTLSTSLIAAFHVNPIEGGLSEDKGVRWVVVAKMILRVVHSSWFNSYLRNGEDGHSASITNFHSIEYWWSYIYVEL